MAFERETQVWLRMANITSPLSALNQSPQGIIVSQQQSIVALQDQVNNIQAEVTGINSGLQGISTLIQNDSILEKTRLLEEQNKEKQLSESRARIGKEEEVEKSLDASLTKSVKPLESKLTSVLDGVSNSLKLLFFGFLGKGLISAIRGVADFAIKGFSNIKSFVSKTLGVVGDTISWLRKGFNGVVNSIGNVIKKVGGVITTLVKSPFKFISDLFKKSQGVVSRGAAAAGSAVSAGTDFLSDILKGGLKAAGRVAGPVLGGAAVAGVDIATGEKPEKALAGAGGAVIGGTAGAVLGAPLGPLGSFAGSVALGAVGQGLAKSGYEMVSQVFGDKKSPPTPNTSNPPIAPTSSSKSSSSSTTLENTNPLSKYNLNVNPTQFFNMNTEGSKSSVSGFEMVGAPKSEVKDTTKTKTETPTKPQAQIQPPPKNNQSVGALPEPKPNIIMASTVTQNQNKSQSGPKPSAGTDVPLISSFNSDNFYTLYSQTHYNVVI